MRVTLPFGSTNTRVIALMCSRGYEGIKVVEAYGADATCTIEGEREQIETWLDFIHAPTRQLPEGGRPNEMTMILLGEGIDTETYERLRASVAAAAAAMAIMHTDSAPAPTVVAPVAPADVSVRASVH